jgi:hypothetical protein
MVKRPLLRAPELQVAVVTAADTIPNRASSVGAVAGRGVGETELTRAAPRHERTRDPARQRIRTNPTSPPIRGVPEHERTQDPQDCWPFQLALGKRTRRVRTCLTPWRGHRPPPPGSVSCLVASTCCWRCSAPAAGLRRLTRPAARAGPAARHGFPRSHGPPEQSVAGSWLR